MILTDKEVVDGIDGVPVVPPRHGRAVDREDGVVLAELGHDGVVGPVGHVALGTEAGAGEGPDASAKIKLQLGVTVGDCS